MGYIYQLNQDWLFHYGDDPDADRMGYDDRAWHHVTLPHDWSVEFPFDKSCSSGTGYLPGGRGWYRKHFMLGEEIRGKRVRLTFGGIYKHARVYINSNYAGCRAYGYSTFTLDVTGFVRPGENVIAVRVEHDDTADSRWFTGSGIDRDVALEISNMCAFRTNGVFITTQSVENGTACIRIEYEAYAGTAARFIALDAEENIIAETTSEGATGMVALAIPDAKLWSPDSPSLYTLRCILLDDEREADEIGLRFGVRTFCFDADKGFFLNGENMKLRGVCLHHDAGCLGAAVPKTVWKRRLEKFKACGVNAIRTSHNPPDVPLLELCDEMGFLVMDEAFDEWEGAKNKWWHGHNVYPPKRFGYAEDFPVWHEADLSAMVLRDRNHPSIILWSIGNEIDYPNDPYVTPLFKEVLGNNDANKPAAERVYDPRKPDAGRLAVIAKELTEIVHRLDSTRPVLSAFSFPELSTRTGFADAVDLSGYNYKEGFYDEDHVRFPSRVIMGSENGHSGSAWKAVLERDFISGQFLWTGVDYLGECPGWPVRIATKGLLDTAGYEKPLYYQRKAMWAKEHFVKIAVSSDGSARNERFSWTGSESEMKIVSCYTDADEVELFLNGVSLGRKPVTLEGDCRAQFEVPYTQGLLHAVTCDAEEMLHTPEQAASIEMKPDCTPSEGEETVVQTELYLKAADGSPAIDESVRIQLMGDAEILGLENGAPDDLTPYSSHTRSTRDGRMIVYLRTGHRPGRILLHAMTEGGLEADCIIR